MRLPAPPACGTRIELRASPLARDPHALSRAGLFLGIGAAFLLPHVLFGVESIRLLALSLVLAAGFLGMGGRALRLVSRARLDHAVVLTQDALSFRDAHGRAVQMALADVRDARVAHPKGAGLTAVVLSDDSGELVLPGEYLPIEWSARDLATRIAFRAERARQRRVESDGDGDVDAAVEALAVSGSDAAILEQRDERWRVRWTFNVTDARAVVGQWPPQHRIVCRASAVDALHAALGQGYRDDARRGIEPVAVPHVTV